MRVKVVMVVATTILPYLSVSATPALEPPTLNVVFTRAIIDAPNLEENEKDIANELNSLCVTTTNSDLLNQCGAIDSLPDEQVPQSLREIAPDEIPIQGSGTLEVATSQIKNIRMRLQSLRTTTPRIALNGLSLELDGQYIPVTMLVAGVLGGAASADDIFNNQLGLFINGVIGVGKKESTARELGYDFKVHGLTGGVDYRVTDQWVIGGALTYTDTDSDFSLSGGSHKGDVWGGSVYGTYYPSQLIHADWMVNYGRNRYQTTRNINTLGASTQGETNGDQWLISLNVGADYHQQAWMFTPYCSMEYIKANIDGYTEQGGSGLALQFAEQNITSFTVAAGGQVTLATSNSWGVLTPSAYAEWIHEFEDDARRITSRFAADPSASFAVRSDNPDRDYFNIGFSLMATFAQGKMGFISIETALDQDDVERYQVFTGIRLEL